MSSTGERPDLTGPETDLGAEVSVSAEAMGPIRSGADRYGDAFLAFLTLPGVDAADPQIIERFIDVYAGYYEDRRALIDAQLDSLGWSEALVAFRSEQGIWDDDLAWNYDTLWRHCLEVYSVNERFGGVHAFFL